MVKPEDTEDSSGRSSSSSSSAFQGDMEEANPPASLNQQQQQQQSPQGTDDNNLQEEMETRRSPTDQSSSSSCLERLRAKNREWHKNGWVILLLIAVVAFLIADSTKFCIVPMLLSDFLEWVEENPLPGIFAFTVVFMLATVLLIPGAILTLGAGYVFANAFGIYKGIVLGSVSTFVGAVAGSLASFLIGRYLLRDWVSRLSSKYEKFEALNCALDEKGIRIMVLLRLSPAIPYNIINYLCGITGLSVFEYTCSLLALLPGTVLYVFLGASAGSLASTNESGNGSTTTTIVIVASVVFGIAAIGLTSYYAKRELDKITERKRQTQLDSTTEVFVSEDSNMEFEASGAISMEEGERSSQQGGEGDSEEKPREVRKGRRPSNSKTSDLAKGRV